MTAPAVPSFEERLAALRADWQALLPQRLRELAALLRACRATPLDSAALQDLHRGVHTLAGGAGTFGLPALSQEARSLEQRIEALMEQPAMTQADIDGLQPGLDALSAHAGG